MGERSSLEFRSNIYPVVTKGQIASDRRFLDSISDPFALTSLWSFNATQGKLLNKLQRRQQAPGQHCQNADPEDYPWGTVEVDGKKRVVCLCEKIDCPSISECRPGFVIESSHAASTDILDEDVDASPVESALDLTLAASEPSQPSGLTEDGQAEPAESQLLLDTSDEGDAGLSADEQTESADEQADLAAVPSDVTATDADSGQAEADGGRLVSIAPAGLEDAWDGGGSSDSDVSEVRPEAPAELPAQKDEPTPAPAEDDANRGVRQPAWDVERPAKRRVRKQYDERQAAIVEADPGRRLYVTAGPGTGKTFTLIEKLKYLIDVQEVDPESILVMSFTRAAVQVVKDRLQTAALRGELDANWQAIDITTFDKFCTRLLYWLKENAPETLGRREIGQMDYDHRINAAAKLIRENPLLIASCRHFIVDETQDLVGPRARLVLSMVSALPAESGITLLGDRCQSVYDYQVRKGKDLNSESFFDGIKETGSFSELTLDKNYRSGAGLPFSLGGLRSGILARDVDAARGCIAEISSRLGEPEEEMRRLDLRGLADESFGTLGILTRTNAQAISISTLLYKHGVVHTLLRAEREAFWSRLVTDVFLDYGHSTVDEDSFVRAATACGVSLDSALRSWVGLTTLRGAKREGARYRVEDLLKAMAEEVVPESLLARKSAGSAVSVSTIHGSKGREYDRVWMLADDLSGASSSSDLDELKVAYVALSRARTEVSLQSFSGTGLKIDHEGERCYRISAPTRARSPRNSKKRVTHIELINSKDLDQGSLLSTPELSQLARGGLLEGVEVRLSLPEHIPEDGLVAYDIETDDGIPIGKTTKSFFPNYERYNTKVGGGSLNYFPDAFDELYVDKVITCVGKSALAPASARRFGEYALWYGFTLGGFAHMDMFQGH